MTKEMAPATRLYGSEVEYSFTLRGRENIDLLEFSIPTSIPAFGSFLGNGGRLYPDIGLIEYATPECGRLEELVAHELAGERIALEVAAGIKGILTLHKRTISPDTKMTYGTHENYLTTLDIWSQSGSDVGRSIVALATHFATRTVFTGAGFYHRGQVEIGQKMSHVRTCQGTKTTEMKPLVNMRAEHHDGQSNQHRLHVVCGDANISPWAIRMKFGTTSLVLRLLEHRVHLDHLLLKDPLETAWDVGKGVDLGAQNYVLKNGKKASALDIQEMLIEECRSLGEKVELPEEERVVLADWIGVIDALKRYAQYGDQDPLLLQIDWYTKKKLIARAQERTPTMFPVDKQLVDLQYDWVDIGTGFGLRKAGRLFSSHTPSEDDVEKAKVTPPEGRANLRGDIIKQSMLGKLQPISRVDWDLVHFKNDEQLVMPPIGDYSPEANKRAILPFRI